MLEQFTPYFQEIEMSAALQMRAEQLCLGFRSLLGERIEHVFVTDSYDNDGVRRYQSFWLCSGNILMEMKNFILLDNIDFVNLAHGVRWIQVEKEELGDI